MNIESDDEIKNKLKQLIKDLFSIDGFNWEEEDEDFILKSFGWSYDTMISDIKIGVKNGYSVDFQIDLVKNVLEK